jgi:PAS domain S-box-containing protein
MGELDAMENSRSTKKVELPKTDLHFEKALDPRIEKITDLVVNFSMGNFESKLEPSGKFDEIDAFITIMNMVGEELKSSTISRNHFNNIFDSVSDMLFVLNNEGVVLSVNKAVNDKLGYSEFQLKDRSLDCLLDNEAPTFDLLLKKLQGEDPSVDLETYIYSHGGKALPVVCSCSYLFNQQHESIGYLVIARDISKIRKYEQSLRESEEKYKRIFEESSDTIFVADKDGNFLDLNRAGLNLLKWSEARFSGLNLFALFTDESNRELVRQEIFDNGIVVDFKIRLKDFQGNTIACLLSANKISNESGDANGFQGVIKDVSQQKALENLVIRTIIDTQEKERKRFAMDLHDSLGQQLSAIKFYLATLKSIYGFDDSKASDILTKSNDALDRVLSELRNICFNLMPGTLQSFGLKHALYELCKKIEFDSLLEFDILIDPAISDLEKPLEIAIFRIVQEFINNSIRHGHAKKVTIRMNLESSEEGGERLFTSLEDDGDGFAVKNISKYEGMGLKNVKSRVESYNGEIKITSIPDKGTRYEVIIPRPKRP